MGPGGGFHQPTGAGQLVCIGDASATGHFVSLYKRKHPEQGFHALFLGTTPLPAKVLDMPIHCLTEASLISRLEQLSLPSQDTTFYVAGYIPMVVQIRKLLKQYGWKQIKATGFWE
jgi:NADPH-dependent ferric siderophore reductase